VRHALLFFSLVGFLSAQTFNVTVTGGDQSAIAGGEFGQPISVQVMTPTNLPVAGVTVTVTLPPGGTEPSAQFNFNVRTVTLTTNSQGIATTGVFAANNEVGRYSGTVTVAGKQTFSFQLSNIAYAPPSVAPDTLVFNMILGDPTPAPQTVTVISQTNAYDATVDAPWVKLTQRSNTNLVVAVDPTGLQPGRYQANISINKQTVVLVFFTITARPQLFSLLGSAGLTFIYIQFAPQQSPRPLDQFVTIWSSQTNLPVVVDETYASPANGKWLAAASKKGTVTPVNLEIVVDPTGLTPGTYQGNVRITADSAGNSPLLIPVTLIVKRFPNARQPEIASVTNGVSLQDGALSSDSVASLAADNLNCSSDPVVTIDGNSARQIAGGNGRLNFIVPTLPGRHRSQVQVSCDGQSSTPYSVPMAAAAPGFFVNVDGTAVADQIANVDGRRAVRLYGTGLGGMTPVDDSGRQIPALPIRVWMGGVQGSVKSVVPSADFPGIMELVVLVPDTVDPGSIVTLDIQVDDAPAQPGMKIAINQ
jgi:uncharacterized protein (TIGR03437 family)